VLKIVPWHDIWTCRKGLTFQPRRWGKPGHIAMASQRYEEKTAPSSLLSEISPACALIAEPWERGRENSEQRWEKRRLGCEKVKGITFPPQGRSARPRQLSRPWWSIQSLRLCRWCWSHQCWSSRSQHQYQWHHHQEHQSNKSGKKKDKNEWGD